MILDYVNTARGPRVASFAVFDQKGDSWLTIAWQGVEMVPLFQSRKDAEDLLSKNPKGKAIVVKVSTADVAERILSTPNGVTGMLLVASSGEMKPVVLRDTV